jgi:hypothetical protein
MHYLAPHICTHPSPPQSNQKLTLRLGGESAFHCPSSAKLNEVDPRAWLADVLARIADHPASRLNELLPWHWPRLIEDRTLAA